MQFFVNKDENVIDALQNIIDFLKDKVGNYPVIADGGMEITFNAKNIYGAEYDKNTFHYILENGWVTDVYHKMTSEILSEYKETIRMQIRGNTNPIVMEKRIDNKIKKVENQIKKFVKNGYNVEGLKSEIENLKIEKSKIPETADFNSKIKNCLDNHEYCYGGKYLTGKNKKDIAFISCVITFDPKGRYFKKPVYFSTQGFSDTEPDELDVNYFNVEDYEFRLHKNLYNMTDADY